MALTREKFTGGKKVQTAAHFKHIAHSTNADFKSYDGLV